MYLQVNIHIYVKCLYSKLAEIVAIWD